MKKLLKFLDGKKAIIGGILNAVNSYLMAAEVYDTAMGALVTTIILALTGVGISATNKVLGRRNKLGERVK